MGPISPIHGQEVIPTAASSLFIWRPNLIMLTAYIAQAILLDVTLSYLGLGVTEPTGACG